MADQKYTPLGHGIWRWKRWKAMDPECKVLWLFFYTSREAKGSVPGLWPGSVYGMADSGLSPNDAYNALDKMVRQGLIQYDADNQLVRLTELPDTLDRAHTEQAIWGWWGRFKTLPPIPLRDIHVPVLWAMVSDGKVNPKMAEVWKQTFDTIVIPTQMPTCLPLTSSDTSTMVQPSLFGSSALVPSASDNHFNNSGPTPLATGVATPLATELRSGSGEGSGSGSGIPEGGRVRLQLVPDPTPAEVERETRAREMREAIVEAGGGHLIGAKDEA